MGSSRQGWKLPSPPAPLPKRARGEIALSRDHDHECTVPDMVPGEGSNRCSETPKTLNNVRLSANVFRRQKVRIPREKQARPSRGRSEFPEIRNAGTVQKRRLKRIIMCG